MTPDQLRDLCLSLRGAHEDFPFGIETSVFRVAGKMFALSALGGAPLTVNLKCEPELAVELRRAHPGAITPGWHMNKRHWNTVRLDGSLPDEDVLLRQLVEDSYDLVYAGLQRNQRAALEHGIDPVDGRRLSGA